MSRPEYYTEVDKLVSGLKAKSIIDVGCGKSNQVEGYIHIPERYAFSLWNMPELKGVNCLQGDILTYDFKRQFDIVMCEQVLEHIQNIRLAITKLFIISNHHVIISLPYYWAAGKEPGHIHDPVTKEKIADWFTARNLISSKIIGNPQRIILYFVK
jgi:SAM-dependent methyltransferase